MSGAVPTPSSETRRIAVVGASRDRRKFGNKAVRAYLQAGWEVVPVNPRGGLIEGLETVATVGDIPGRLDRISVYLQPEVTSAMVAELVARGAGEIWLNPGSADGSTLAAFRAAGGSPISGCSIVDIGIDPSDLS